MIIAVSNTFHGSRFFAQQSGRAGRMMNGWQ